MTLEEFFNDNVVTEGLDDVLLGYGFCSRIMNEIASHGFSDFDNILDPMGVIQSILKEAFSDYPFPNDPRDLLRHSRDN